MKQVRYNGVIHQFPDDATDDEIAAALDSLDTEQQAAKQGDDRTAMQVAKDQAAAVLRGIPQAITGIPSAAASTAGAIGEALTGGGTGKAQQLIRGAVAPLTTSLRGAGALVAPNRIQAPTSEEFQQAAEGAGALAGGIALGEAIPKVMPPLVRKVGKILPNTERAGAKLQTVMQSARNVPQDLTQTDLIAARAKQLQQRGGGTPPPVVQKYLARQKPVVAKFGGQKVAMQPQPMTYEEGFDFASAAGSQSAKAMSEMTGPMKAQVKQFAGALRNSNRQAAAQVGMGDLYDQAIKEYRQAKTLEEAKDVVKRYALHAAIGTGVLYGIEREVERLFGR